MPTSTASSLLGLLALAGCAARGGNSAGPTRLSDLRWSTCPATQNTEILNGASEAIRVIASEGPSGSPTPQAPISMGIIQRGESDLFNNIGPTMRFIEVVAVERPREINGEIRRPVGYQRIQLRCVPRTRS